MEILHSIFTIFSIAKWQSMQGKKVLNRSWVTPYSLGFQADQLIKLIISSFVLVLEVIRILLGPLYDILAFLRK